MTYRGIAVGLVLAAVAVGAATGLGAAAGSNATVTARYPNNGTAVEETVITPGDVAKVSAPREQRGRWVVSMTLTESGARSFADAMNADGFTSDVGIRDCTPTPSGDPRGYCLLTGVDGDVLYSAGMSQGLAQSIRSGAWLQTRTFVLQADNASQARRLARAFGSEPGRSTDAGAGAESNASAATSAGAESTSGGSPGFSALAAALAALGAVALARRG